MSATIKVVFDLTDGSWSDLYDHEKINKGTEPMNALRPGTEYLSCEDIDMSIGRIPGGMQSGSPSVMIRVDRKDGTTVLIETSLKVFIEVGKVMSALNQSEEQANNELRRIAGEGPQH